MSAADIEAYLHEHIPLSAAMQAKVISVEGGVRISAPLEPNINHRGTMFGGSIAALAILAGWSTVHAALQEAGVEARIVIRSNEIEYDAAVLGDLEAFCPAPEPAEWERFLANLKRRGRARLTLAVDLLQDGEVAARFSGVYVALPL